mmetsp:Transcript_21322/g.60875  ORF Transcript_21322/g.60875 Transcript_21322/m.60875 type:complete len:2078 (-) Transcript_21322:137-6370(-)|eukprot:CAMPEP_0119561934 /NCGR_PEP_ID=MMETSP1352-20130426/19049_1 /TAXON_ID=265584 /ORGANISM="Stauroneis constricta, Strain CCMP1120" /LENGTH=2077 /DNA_ID=CAMNT_0007610249 /DNA_START=107 /DNA_END=6340 /DNA_ORIENTATION=-
MADEMEEEIVMEESEEFSIEIEYEDEEVEDDVVGSVQKEQDGEVISGEGSYYTIEEEYEVASESTSSSEDCNSSVPDDRQQSEDDDDDNDEDEDDDEDDDDDDDDDNDDDDDDEAGAFYLTLTDFTSMAEISSIGLSQGMLEDDNDDDAYIVEEVMYMDETSNDNVDNFDEEEVIEAPDASASDKWNQMHQSADWTYDEDQADDDLVEVNEVEGFFETYEDLLEESEGEGDEADVTDKLATAKHKRTSEGGDENVVDDYDDDDANDDDDADADANEGGDDDDGDNDDDDDETDDENEEHIETTKGGATDDATAPTVSTGTASNKEKSKPKKSSKSKSSSRGSKSKSKEKSKSKSKKLSKKKKKTKKKPDPDKKQKKLSKPVFDKRKRKNPKSPSRESKSDTAPQLLEASKAGDSKVAPPTSVAVAPTGGDIIATPDRDIDATTAEIHDHQDDSVELFAGRSDEIEQLQKSLVRIGSPVPTSQEVIYISGPAGVGKTALVEEFYHHLPSHVMFAYGSFDEAREKSKAFSGLANCLTMLVDGLLVDYEVGEWKNRLRQNLGKSAPLLARIIPNLSTLLGIDAKVEKVVQGFDITTQRRYDRLRFAMRALLVTICTHVPVVMILDDVHFAGDDSLRMMETFLSTKALKNFMLICCHRPMKSTHSLSIFRNRLREVPSIKITMKNVDETACADIIASRLQDSLNHDIDTSMNNSQLTELSTVLFQKTSGNPLLLVQTVELLIQKGLISWNEADKQLWFQLQSVKDESLVPTTATKVVERRLRGIPKKCAVVLKSAAMLGLSQFDVETLVYFARAMFDITRKRGEEPSALTPAALTSILHTCEEKHFMKRLSDTVFAFSHDLIKKCSNALFPLTPKNKMRLHFRLGSDLSKMGLASSGAKLDVQEMFKLLAMDQSNQAVALVGDEKDKAPLAKLNLDLSDLAMSKGAFLEALYKADAGLGLLNVETMWSEHYELTCRLMLSKARLMFCTRMAPPETIQVAETILQNATKESDKLGAYQILVFDLIERNVLDVAHDKTLEVLHALDEVMPTDLPSAVSQEMIAVEKLLASMSNTQLCTLPKMTHRKTISKMSFLAILAEISRMRGDASVETICATRMMKSTVQYGSCHVTALSYSLYAMALGRRNIQRMAFRFGRLAEALAKPETLYGGIALANHHWEINYIRRPFGQSLDVMATICNFSFGIASTEQLSYHIGTYLSNLLASGSHSLLSAELLCVRFQQFMFDWRVKDSWRVFVPYQLILDLMGNAEDNHVDYEQRVRRWNESGNMKAIQYLNFVRMFSEFIFGNFLEAGTMRRRLIGWRPDGVWRPYIALVDCMLALYQAKHSTGKEQHKHFDRANVILKYLDRLAVDGCTNCMSIATLLGAELELARNRKGLSAMKVRSLFDPAISIAEKHGLLLQQALANELAGRFFLTVRDEAWAAAYLTEAWYLYDQWGASGKTEQLEDEFGMYLDCRFPPRHPNQGQPRRTRRPRMFDPHAPRLPTPPPAGPQLKQIEHEKQHLNPTELSQQHLFAQVQAPSEQQQEQQQRLQQPVVQVSIGQQLPGRQLQSRPGQGPGWPTGSREAPLPPPRQMPHNTHPIQPHTMALRQQSANTALPPNQNLMVRLPPPGTRRQSANGPFFPSSMGGISNLGPAPLEGRGRSHRALRPSAPGLIIDTTIPRPSSAKSSRRSFRDLAMMAQSKGRSHRLKKPEVSQNLDSGGEIGDLSTKLNGMKRKDKKKSRWRKNRNKNKKSDKVKNKDVGRANEKSPRQKQSSGNGLFHSRRRALSNEEFPTTPFGDGGMVDPTSKPVSWRGPMSPRSGNQGDPLVKPTQTGSSQSAESGSQQNTSRLGLFRKGMPWQKSGDGTEGTNHSKGSKKKGKGKGKEMKTSGSKSVGSNNVEGSSGNLANSGDTLSFEGTELPTKKGKSLRQKMFGSGKKKKATKASSDAASDVLGSSRSDMAHMSMSMSELDLAEPAGPMDDPEKMSRSYGALDALDASSHDGDENIEDSSNHRKKGDKTKTKKKKKKDRRASATGELNLSPKQSPKRGKSTPIRTTGLPTIALEEQRTEKTGKRASKKRASGTK